MITSFTEWVALRETFDPSDHNHRGKNWTRFLSPPAARAGAKPLTLAQKFVDGFRAKHPDLWQVLDTWTEQQGKTVDDLAEEKLKERSGDVLAVYWQFLRLAQQVGGRIV